MILTYKNIKYSQKGVDNIKELPIDKAILYRSPSKIETVGYSGTADIVKKSDSISPQYFKYLVKLKGYMSLGTTGTGSNKKYKNIHIYSERAVYLDGIDRICYLYGNNDVLKVTEYKKGTRGSRYSSLYRILHEKLIESNFDYRDDSFEVTLNNVSKFVDIVNSIIEDQGNYILVKDEKIDEISFGIFNVAYYDYIDNLDEKTLSIDDDKNNFKKLEQDIFKLINTLEPEQIIDLQQILIDGLKYSNSKLKYPKL